MQDTRRHGVEVRPIDVGVGDWNCTLEGNPPALRLGLRMVKGLSRAGAERITAARPFRDVEDLARRARLDRRDLTALAAADALRGLCGNRHQARWQVLGIEAPLPLGEMPTLPEPVPMLRRPTEGEDIAADYGSLGLTLRRHPLALLRPVLTRLSFQSAHEVLGLTHGSAHAAGLVITRQRPATATGVVFLTLEDETGPLNVIVWSDLFERERRIVLGARLMGVTGEVQREGEVVHLIARSLEDRTALLGGLRTAPPP